MILQGVSCATLNVNDIASLDRGAFEPLRLTPEIEPNYLRFDLIRKTEAKPVNDSASETVDLPYHPLGFYLGNGLFYDFNGNLTIRADYLLHAPAEGFHIRKSGRPEKNKGITEYIYRPDTLYKQYPHRKKPIYQYHRLSENGVESFMYGHRLRYIVETTDSTIVYRGKRRKWDVLYRDGPDAYYLNRRRWVNHYRKSEEGLVLGSDYLVTLADGGRAIHIKRGGKKRDRLLYTIERDADRVFIYDRKKRGRMITFEGNSFLVYRNQTLLMRYELGGGG